MVNVNAMFGSTGTKSALGEAMTTLNQTAQEGRPKVMRILDHLEHTTASMNQASASLAEVSKSINQLFSEKNKMALNQSLDHLQASAMKLSATMEHVKSLAEKLDAGEGPVGVLLSDKEMGKDLKALMKDLRANPSIFIWGPKK